MFLWQYLATLLLITVQIHKAEICQEFTDLNLAHAVIGTNVRIKLLLYTRENSTCGTIVSHANLTTQTRFNLSRSTIFIIHGYRPTGSPPMWVHSLTEAMLSRVDSNVIVVDWNYGATNVNYFKAVENTRITADNLTEFIQTMKDSGASLSSIHMIGISLGAHISGFVGAKLNAAIGRITALDPAGPKFTGQPPEERLDPSDAQFVDVLHTDIDCWPRPLEKRVPERTHKDQQMPLRKTDSSRNVSGDQTLGFREPLGHIDFYANGGTDQPGCPKTILSGSSYFKCDHQRSVLLFKDSVNKKCAFEAFPCTSYKDFLDGSCLNCQQFGAAGCPLFGYDVTDWKDVLLKLGKTKMYFTTNSQSPFCMTNYRVDVQIWNRDARWGYLTVKLYGNDSEAVATIDHQASEFKRHRENRLFAQFDRDIENVKKVSMMFSTGNVFQPKRKLRVLRLRLTPLDPRERPQCRYDVVLEEDKEMTFRPIPCEEPKP